MKRVIFALLLFCLFIAPVSAEDWELSFEDSANEVGSFSDMIVLNSDYLQLVSAPSTEWPSTAIYGRIEGSFSDRSVDFDVNSGFDSYLGFTTYATTSYFIDGTMSIQSITPGYTITGYDSSGDIVFLSSFRLSSNIFHRVELTKSISGFLLYIDGSAVQTDVFDFNDEIVKFNINCRVPKMASKYWLSFIADDFSTTYWSLGGNDKVSGDIYSLSYGVAPAPSRTQIIKLFGPNGDVIQTDDLGSTSCGVLSYDTSLFDSPGDYTFRLYAVYNGGSISYLSSKTVTSGETKESDCSIELDKTSYSAGDEMSIYTFTSPYESGYQLKIYSKTALEKTISITSQDQNSKYVIPDDALSGNWLIKLVAPDGSTEIMKSFSVIGTLYPDTAIRFEKDAYTTEEKVRIFYDDLPRDTTVLLTGSRSGPIKVFNKQWDDRKGAGTLTYQLTGQDIEYLEVIASCNGQVVASDLVLVSQGSDYILTGAVYDASSNVPIPGCEIGSSTFKYTDQAGRYSLTLPAGLNAISLSANGYHSQDDNITLSSPTTTKNWYLVPITNATGGTIYGATANYADGSPVESVYVRIYNNSGTSYSMLTRSKTGYFSFDLLPEGSTWTLTASKTDYDNYQATVSVSGDTLHLVRMVPEDYDPNAPITTPGSPGSSPGSTTDDRPSRAAARESLDWLESTIPSLIQLVVLVFLLALLGVKL